MDSFLLGGKEMNYKLFKSVNLKELGQLRRYISIIYNSADFYDKHFVNKTIITLLKIIKLNSLQEEITLCIYVEFHISKGQENF